MMSVPAAFGRPSPDALAALGVAVLAALLLVVAAPLGVAGSVFSTIDHRRWCRMLRAEGVQVKFYLPSCARVTLLAVSAVAVPTALTALFAAMFGSATPLAQLPQGEQILVVAVVLALGLLEVLAVPWAFVQSRRSRRARERAESDRRALTTLEGGT